MDKEQRISILLLEYLYEYEKITYKYGPDTIKSDSYKEELLALTNKFASEILMLFT